MTTSAATAPIEMSDETVDQLIARVLRQAHGTMEAFRSPSEARAVLHVAHSFADELAALDPDFDRPQFIRHITRDPS